MTWFGLWLVLTPTGIAVMLLCQKFSSGKPRRRSWQALERILLPR